MTGKYWVSTLFGKNTRPTKYWVSHPSSPAFADTYCSRFDANSHLTRFQISFSRFERMGNSQKDQRVNNFIVTFTCDAEEKKEIEQRIFFYIFWQLFDIFFLQNFKEKKERMKWNKKNIFWPGGHYLQLFTVSPQRASLLTKTTIFSPRTRNGLTGRQPWQIFTT